MRNSHKTILVWAMLLFTFFLVWQLINPRAQDQKLAFSEFIQKVEKSPGDFKATPLQIRMNGNNAEFRGTLKKGDEAFVTTGFIGEQTLEKLNRANIPYEISREAEGGFWQQMLITWLPIIVVAVVFLLFMRQLQMGGGKAMSFGKSKARLLSENQKKITFSDVAGIEEAKDEVEEIIAFLKDPKKFTRLGGRIPKGVLMMGPPGTGKTLLARAIAGEAGVPFFSISGSDFVEMFVGVGASRVRDLFEQGKKNAPCIVFIDEIDAVGRHRGAGLGGGHDEREQTLNQLLVEMDGFESNDGVILIAATNRPDVLDPALLRPGRFDRRIVVPRPDVKGRLGILKVHTKKMPLGPNVDLDVVARGTPGFSGADLENLVNEAALLAAREDKDQLDRHDFEMAKDKVLMGPERRSMIISDQDKRITAFHEAGHALVGKMMKGSAPVHKVTIIPRGRALPSSCLWKTGSTCHARRPTTRSRWPWAAAWSRSWSSGRSPPARPTTFTWPLIWHTRWSVSGVCPTRSGHCISGATKRWCSWAATSPSTRNTASRLRWTSTRKCAGSSPRIMSVPSK